MNKQTNKNCFKQLAFAVLAAFILLISSNFAAAQEAKALFEQGNKLFDKGKYTEAIAVYQKSAALAPDIPDIQFNIELSYEKLKQFDKAVEYFRKAAQLDVENIDIWDALADILFEQERWAESAEAYEHLIKLKPTADYYDALGASYYNIEQFDKAAAAYREVIRLDLKDNEAKKGLADSLFELEKWVEAAAAYERLVKLKPTAENYNALGDSYYNNKQFDKAAAYRQALRLDPKDKEAKQSLADAEAQMRQNARNAKTPNAETPKKPKR